MSDNYTLIFEDKKGNAETIEMQYVLLVFDIIKLNLQRVKKDGLKITLIDNGSSEYLSNPKDTNVLIQMVDDYYKFIDDKLALIRTPKKDEVIAFNTGNSYWVDTNPAWPGIYSKQSSGQCNHGGVVSGNGNCQLISFQLPSDGSVVMVPGVAYWVDADPRWPGVYYKQSNGACRFGGIKSGDGNCQLTSLPTGALEDQVIYWADSNSRWPGIYYQQTY